MNRKTTFRFPVFLTFILALLVTACSPPASETPPLAGAAIGGAFTLVDQDQNQRRDADFNGKYRLIYFGYTYCPNICPVDMQLIGQGLRLLEKSDPEIAGKVQPLFITVDPERDTPAILKQFVASFHPRLIGLTGTRAEIADVARRYGVYFARQGEEGAKDYLVDHSRIILLFGPKGEPIAVIPHDKGAAAIKAEIKRWAQ